MGRNKKNAKKTEPMHIPNSVSDSIPYVQVYKNGIIEVENRKFSKTYEIPDVNFKTASDDKQWDLGAAYAEFISSFEEGTNIEVTLYNKTINMDDFQKQVLLPMREDTLNEFRDEYNEMLISKMTGAKNNLTTTKLITITIESIDIFEATDKFDQIDKTVIEGITTMTKNAPKILSIIDRMDLLYQIYNPDSERSLKETRVINGNVVKAFDLDNCVKQGITTKDVIAPPSMEFLTNKAKIGDRIVKSYYIQNYPTWIKGTILTDFADLPANVLVSVHFIPMGVKDSVKLVKNQSTNIASELLDYQKKAAAGGYDPRLTAPSLADAKDEASDLMEGLTKDNDKLFLVSFVISAFANSEEELKGYEDRLKLIATKNLVTLTPLNLQQEGGLASSLPLGNNKIYIDRLMTTGTISSIIPFDSKVIKQKGGMYYGQNASSHEMIIYNRLSDVNPNACILGMPGSGKSFTAKREMINVLLNTEDEVYVIDPEREYVHLAEKMNGSVIKIANGSDKYINPFDLNIENSGDEGNDPVKVKTDFVETICEIMVGGKFGLSPIEQSIIGRSVTNIYDEYIKYLTRTGKKQDFAHAPTLEDFYNDLCMQPQAEAQNLALSLERFVSGSLDVFSHHTNININNRFVVYDIKDIGSGLKELGLQICLDNVWNKMIQNMSEHKRTWIYIDEFYLMMQKRSSSQYISQIWKRARKWNGMPCAITQNVEDMLKSPEARDVINNCSMVTMLGQSPLNRQQLSDMYAISPAEQKYISVAKPGMGLISIQGDIIPVNDDFPKDTKLYKIMSTKPDERVI